VSLFLCCNLDAALAIFQMHPHQGSSGSETDDNFILEDHMSTTLLRRSFAFALIAIAPFALSACSKGVDGKYVSGAGVMTLNFHSGKVDISSMGDSETADYTVEGDKVTIKAKKGGGDLVLTIMKDGSLEGGMQTFKKSAG
jgi:hypothetical protein